MSFWKKGTEEFLTSKEFDTLSRKITELSSEVEDLKIKFRFMNTNYDNLRGQFNRKLSGLKKEEEQQPDEEQEFKKFTPFGF